MLDHVHVLKSASIAAFVALVLLVAMGILAPQHAYAQYKANENDMEVPTNDATIVEQGKAKFSQRCSFCHGGDGHGGKGPCLTCGVFHYSGNTNSDIYGTIATGISNRSRGGTMGAFGTSMTAEEILSVVTFLRWEEKRRIAAGEVPDPSKEGN